MFSAIPRRCAALLIALLSMGSGPAVPISEDLTPYVIEASTFVADTTDDVVPRVVVRRGTQLELQIAVFGNEPSLWLHRTEVAAVFDPFSGDIVIADDIDLTTPLGLSFLVHELVHSQQFAAGRQTLAPCLGTLEAEAYALQARFLRSRQLPRDAFLFELLGLLQSSCNEHLR